MMSYGNIITEDMFSAASNAIQDRVLTGEVDTTDNTTNDSDF